MEGEDSPQQGQLREVPRDRPFLHERASSVSPLRPGPLLQLTPGPPGPPQMSIQEPQGPCQRLTLAPLGPSLDTRANHQSYRWGLLFCQGP
ncbi:hypothetical protein MATL_G00049570 [Megalops atlanticus]|uniref:Uncharacterized protein n=1 Tax=Megalops atlanticus TaxID=7932 RepID=A0A9D3TIW2_MEGAT|nr:hypothetical protein MATL_G00049570 [Megalops atlanticus]